MYTLPKNVLGNPDIVAFVGPDGGGKTLRIEHARKVFSDKPIFWTKEPGGGGDTALRSAIFEYRDALSPALQLAAFFTDRVLHMFRHTFPALLRKEKVFLDRSWLCSKAFNVPKGDNALNNVFLELLRGLPREGLPGFIVYCTCEPEESRRRANGGRAGEVTPFDKDDVHVYRERIAIYDELCAELADMGVKVLRIDTTTTGIDENNSIVETAIREHFGW